MRVLLCVYIYTSYPSSLDTQIDNISEKNPRFHSMSENRILFAISSILLLFAVNSTAQGNINCASSSCGNIRISYPFRLRSASTSCGYDDPSFELQCQNNQTIFNAGTRRYIVQDINYDYYSIRLVDPSISRANLSSCPVYSNGYDDWPSMFSNFLLWDWNMPVSFIYCLAPVNSSKYVEGPFCGNRSNIFSNSSQLYSYVMEGDRTVVSDLEESCTVDRVVWTSGRRGMRDASSLAAIYDDLAYGVELSWFRVYCGQCERTDGYCSLEERRITCKHYCVEGGALSDRSLKCQIEFWAFIIGVWAGLAIGGLLALRFLIGFVFLIVLVVRKWRQRKLPL